MEKLGLALLLKSPNKLNIIALFAVIVLNKN